MCAGLRPERYAVGEDNRFFDVVMTMKIARVGICVQPEFQAIRRERLPP